MVGNICVCAFFAFYIFNSLLIFDQKIALKIFEGWQWTGGPHGRFAANSLRHTSMFRCYSNYLDLRLAFSVTFFLLPNA